MEDIIQKIEELKKERDAVILAHYYVNDEVQDVADYIGDSYYLSKIATTVTQKTILFCGVTFMGESAKILNPDKLVIMPDLASDCPMAHMADIDMIDKVRKEYEDVAVVCYINSTAELKTYSDVIVTSSNAVKIVKNLPNKNIFFIPDENLGRYVAEQVPEKNFIFNDGFCHVHTSITKDNLLKAKEAHPDALILVHPECTLDVVKIADYVGSTSGIIDYATNSDTKEFIIGTEMGILYELKKKNPDKKFYSVGHRQFCPNMKRITLEKVYQALLNLSNEVTLEEELRQKANKPLARMLTLAE
ncbi:quinolinate synthase NadA [Anaeromicropila herbilytica]|uniref:Quinolinate synthase n=1 Tax=Anaeromicropila herbilytica TaxID=2785025 RepID=A0A7R7ID60_9FIRM|nr:quinolinate synthase NadA [Anaeromicropila herbilytica]BCN30576.1 quinolinate synthase A [Anaeromicropila herbilytica]